MVVDCEVCGGSPIVGSRVRGDRALCQDCAESAQNRGDFVEWYDPWDNPWHEVNQPRGESA